MITKNSKYFYEKNHNINDDHDNDDIVQNKFNYNISDQFHHSRENEIMTIKSFEVE